MKFHLIKATENLFRFTTQQTQLFWSVTFLQVGSCLIVLKRLVAHLAQKAHVGKLLPSNKRGWPNLKNLAAVGTVILFGEMFVEAGLAKQSFATLLSSAATRVPNNIQADLANVVIFGLISDLAFSRQPYFDRLV
jgi:hypothetical protein